MKLAHIVALVLLTLAGCKQAPSPTVHAALVPGPANPVIPVDPNGNYPAAFTTTGGGGFITIDGGTVTTTTGSVTTLQDSGVAVLGTASVDPYAGDFANTVVACTNFVTSCYVDAGSSKFVKLIVQDLGASKGTVQVFCGQAALDAGGTTDAGTVPTIALDCPSGGYCVNPDEPQPCTGGMGVYVSSTHVPLTTDAGVPSFDIHVVVR